MAKKAKKRSKTATKSYLFYLIFHLKKLILKIKQPETGPKRSKGAKNRQNGPKPTFPESEPNRICSKLPLHGTFGVKPFSKPIFVQPDGTEKKSKIKKY